MRDYLRLFLSSLVIAVAAGCGGSGGSGSGATATPPPENPGGPGPNVPDPNVPDPNVPDPNTPDPDPNVPDPNVPDPNEPDPNEPDPNEPDPEPVVVPPTPQPVAGATMLMSCVDGPDFQCSGASILRTEYGVSLTDAGVQVQSRSTSDLRVPNPDSGIAYGMAPLTGGLAEIRLQRDITGQIIMPALLLSEMGITWDRVNERPRIADVFRTTQGRTTLDPDGRLIFGTLPDSSNLGFYDYAVLGPNATQVNYANNSYFPRIDPPRCEVGVVVCPTLETTGMEFSLGDWVTGGREADLMHVSRLHSDGDLFAGNGLPDINGNPTYLPDGTGFGTAYPGFKGYRELYNWGYQYANLSMWLTQDTVEIIEFAGPGNEHNKQRRGFVTFGQVTPAADVPTTGSASYLGLAYGLYVPDGQTDVIVLRANVLVTVDFATRQTTIRVTDTTSFDQNATPLPIALETLTSMGAAGGNVAGYMSGPAASGALAGGMGARLFGPVVSTGTSGAGPAEIGGNFTLNNPLTGATAIAGFIARKQ